MSTDTAVELVRAVIEHMSGGEKGWTSFSMVIRLNPSGSARQSFGYAFDGDGPPIAISTGLYEVRSAVRDFLDERYAPGEAFPVSFRLQFDRNSGKYHVDFEDSDSARWQVTPGNVHEIRESFRPRFD